MFRLRPTYEEIAREARTHRLRILPEKQKRTQQGILLDDVDFDDFDLGKYDKKTILMNENPDKGTQTDVFNETPSVTESESMKTIEEVKQTQTDESVSSIKSIEKEKETEREREQPQKKSVMRRVYDAMFGEDGERSSPSRRSLDEFAEEREEMRSRRQQIEQEEESEPPVEKQQSEQSEVDLPMNVKKSYEPSSSSSSSRRSSNRSILMPVEEEALSEYVNSSPVETVQSSVPSNRTIEYVDEATPPQSIISSRRSQETIEYIRSRSSSRRSSVQSVSS